MVSVARKPRTLRKASAEGRVSLSAAALRTVRDHRLGKGDLFAVARLAGIQAAKRTSEWIPLCHVVPLDAVEVDVELDERSPGVIVRARAVARGATGVEMEALVAVAAASLAVYDMIKALDRGALLGPMGVIAKSGGRSGSWRRSGSAAGPLRRR
jgi:cyclic pyranopterin phosphate synthase